MPVRRLSKVSIRQVSDGQDQFLGDLVLTQMRFSEIVSSVGRGKRHVWATLSRLVWRDFLDSLITLRGRSPEAQSHQCICKEASPTDFTIQPIYLHST